MFEQGMASTGKVQATGTLRTHLEMGVSGCMVASFARCMQAHLAIRMQSEMTPRAANGLNRVQSVG